MQDGSTRDWVFTLPYLLASLSRVMTLEPGDVVILEIEGIGRLKNHIISRSTPDT
ncbi:MAG: fumarylacetoacetate hydrolase family protein [Acidobacteriota bacterium]